MGQVKKAGRSPDAATRAGSGKYGLPRRDEDKGSLLAGPRRKERPGSVKPLGKVLVMDDEDVIRTILSVMLLAFGYESSLTASGEEAIQSYVQALNAGEPFDAVIIDLNIPAGMGGRETVKRLLEIDQGVKAIVSSAYRDDPAARNYEEYGFRAVLHKPYSISELRNVLRKVVSGVGHDSPEFGMGNDREMENLAS